MEELELGEDDAFEGDEDGELADEEVNEEEQEEEEAAPAPTEPLGPDTSARSYRGHGDSVYSVDVSPDGQWCATGSGDDTAQVWRLGDCAPLAALPSGSDTISCVAFNTAGTLLAAGSYDSAVRVYSMAAVQAAGGGGGGGGGGGAASASTALPTAAPLHTLEGPSGDILFLVWHPKGDVLLAGSSDGTAWMWSTPAAGGAATCMQVFAGHAGPVTSGLFTRDGRLLVTGGEDGSVRVWAPKTGACSKVYELGEAPVTALVTSPADAAIVCATTLEGYARVINLASQRVVLSVDHNDKEDKEGSVVEAGGGGGVAGEDEEDSTSVERCVAARAARQAQPWPHTHTHSFFFPWLTPHIHTFSRDAAAPPFAQCSPGWPLAPPMAPWSSRTWPPTPRGTG